MGLIGRMRRIEHVGKGKGMLGKVWKGNEGIGKG